jgi:hypothetical protein
MNNIPQTVTMSLKSLLGMPLRNKITKIRVSFYLMATYKSQSNNKKNNRNNTLSNNKVNISI